MSNEEVLEKNQVMQDCTWVYYLSFNPKQVLGLYFQNHFKLLPFQLPHYAHGPGDLSFC